MYKVNWHITCEEYERLLKSHVCARGKRKTEFSWIWLYALIPAPKYTRNSPLAMNLETIELKENKKAGILKTCHLLHSMYPWIVGTCNYLKFQ